MLSSIFYLIFVPGLGHAPLEDPAMVARIGSSNPQKKIFIHIYMFICICINSFLLGIWRKVKNYATVSMFCIFKFDQYVQRGFWNYQLEY